MAIKVRHDGNHAAVIAAGAGSGRAKRRIETAKLAQNTPQHIQTLGAAHASAPGAGGGSAPLTHAPTGASAASAPLTHAPAPTAGMGGAGSRSSSLRGSGAGGDLGEVKVTGNSLFTRPDKESQWNPATLRWERPWLPGEKEAEAAQRMNPVLAEREQFRQGLANEAAELRGQRETDMLRLRGQQDMDMLREKNLQERGLYDYKLSQKQRMEIAAVTDAVDNARKSGNFTPDEMADIERQATLKLMGIKPLPTPRERDAQQSFDERVVTVGGVQGYINSKGDFEPIQKDDGFANFLKAYPKLAEYEDVDEKGAPVTKYRSADEIARLVQDAQAAWNKARKPATPPDMPMRPAGSGGTAIMRNAGMRPVMPAPAPEPAPAAQAAQAPETEHGFTGVAKNQDDAKKKWGVRK